LIPKPTEDTITSHIAEELRKRGIGASLFVEIPTPSGFRKPDLVCRNGGTYVLEAKFSEAGLLEAITKIVDDYIKHHEVLGIRGGFALLYPKELTKPVPEEAVKELARQHKFKLVAIFPPKDPRPTRVDEGNIDEICEMLSRYILEPARPVEPDIGFIIKSLQEAATYIRNGLRYAKASDLENLFGGREVFENILQYEQKRYPVEDLRSAAAFILVNQLLFYHILSKMGPGFEEIDPEKIRRPTDLREYFSKVLQINYRPIFSYDVTSYISEDFLEQVRAIISVIKGLSVEKVGGDFLGTIFHRLIPLETRKSVAAFYTNVLAAELLASLSIEKPDARVADFAVGSGGLLVAAYRRKKELLGEAFGEEGHRRFVEEDLLGIDVMPFAACVAASHLALQSPQYFTDRVKIGIWDSTELKPGRAIPSVAGLRQVLEGQTYLDIYLPRPERKVKGVVKIGEGEVSGIQLDPCDVVIMNPPFTRQERIPENYKRFLADRFKDYKEYLHGQLGYHGYFILLADRFLKEGGRMALVLPATVLRVKSFEGIRKLWAERYHVEHIITTWHRSAFSESTRFREILLVARKGKAGRGAKTTITVLKKLPATPGEAKEMAEAIKRSREDWEDWRLAIKIHDYSKLKENTDNWFKYIAISDLSLIDIAEKLLASEKLATFRAEIVRGIETARGGKVQPLTISRPERAIKQSDEWIIEEMQESSVKAENRITHLRMEIPLSALRPALRRVSLVNRIDLSGITDYVLVDRFPGLEKFMSGTLAKFKPPEGFWNRWKRYVEERMGRLILVRRTDLSAAGTSLLAFYSPQPLAPPGVAWVMKAGNEEAKILSLWFNSTINILQILLNRKETRGAFMQVDEYVLRKFRVPDLKKLSRDELKSLTEVFESVRSVEFPDILYQLKAKYPPRRTLDKVFLRILGYKGDTDSLLDRLYESLVHEIETLKSLMAERAD
jgi:type I restriction-modification system DNA methylase subunit